MDAKLCEVVILKIIYLFKDLSSDLRIFTKINRFDYSSIKLIELLTFFLYFREKPISSVAAKP